MSRFRRQLRCISRDALAAAPNGELPQSGNVGLNIRLRKIGVNQISLYLH